MMSHNLKRFLIAVSSYLQRTPNRTFAPTKATRVTLLFLSYRLMRILPTSRNVVRKSKPRKPFPDIIHADGSWNLPIHGLTGFGNS